MKKNLLVLFMLVAGVVSMNAQSKREMSGATANYGKVSSMVKSKDASTMVAKKATNFVLKNVEEQSIAPIKAPAAGPEALYYRPAGTLYRGMDPEGRAYSVGLIFGKGYTDWKFLNASTGATSYEWTVNGNTNFDDGTPLIVADNEGNGNAEYVGIGWHYVPQLKAKADTQSNNYEYGFNSPDGNIDARIIGCDDVYNLSSVDLSYISSWYLQDGSYNYYFGTGAINGDPAEGVGILFEKPQAPLSALSMGAHIYSKSNNPLPVGVPLTLTVYPRITNNGKLVIDWENPIISSEVYKEDLTPAFKFSGSSIQVYYAKFGFAEYNPETGLETEIPLVLDDAFAAVLSWDPSNAFDFGVLFADAPHMPGNIGTSVIYAGEYQYALNNDNGVNQCDMSFVIEGLYNTLELDERIESISIPAAGGQSQVVYSGEQAGTYSNALLLSSLQSDIVELENELPEWLNLTEVEDQTVTEGGQEYFANAISLVFEGDALPAGITGRTGKVILNSYGITSTITITQGDGDVGISPVKAVATKAARQGDDFKLTYPASATSVAVYNVTGQKVGDYPLNASGSYTLPAAGWANGVYILKFNGSNTTVKVIK